MKADVAATAARKFKDPGSFVFKDGREFLKGDDWEDRKFELLKRCHGQCEYLIPVQQQSHPIRCTREAADPHHNVLRSVKRDDRLDALTALCRHHHKIVDAEQRKHRHKRG